MSFSASSLRTFFGERNKLSGTLVSTPGHTPQENRDAIHAEIERLRNEDISDEELQMVKTRAKADLLRRLGDNQGLAFQLGTTQSLYSDWRQLFRHIDEIEKVSKTDIRRVANATFLESNRTVTVANTSWALPPQGSSRSQQRRGKAERTDRPFTKNAMTAN